MILFKTAASLSQHLASHLKTGQKTGFVPTMGALHNGHLSLIAASVRNTDLTICSIFVNPTQFNDPLDFEKYPVTIEKDILLLEKSGCAILFIPSVSEIYPNGTAHAQSFELGNLDTVLEGSHRPGHFQGVCQVMHRLLGIVRPTVLFLGQKDFQQCLVIKKLIQATGLDILLNIIPTVRETNGLAMSSRNTRLTETARQKASVIYRALLYLKISLKPGNTDDLLKKAAAMIMEEGFNKIDYVGIADAETLEPIKEWDGQRPAVFLVAAFIEEVRLIDNMIFA